MSGNGCTYMKRNRSRIGIFPAIKSQYIYFMAAKTLATNSLPTLFLGAILSAFPARLNAQMIQTDLEAQSAIKQLEFMVGQWKGSGWIMGRDGQRHNFIQTEDVQFKLDSTVILIEGLGKTGDVVTHNAMAILSYNKAEENYKFHSWLSTGRGGAFTGELKEGIFYWYPGENIRYVIHINQDGQWYEKGEMNRDGSWFQFLEMTLDRAD